MQSYLFTSESVAEGHPDKVCDRLSDALLDLALSHNPEARVAIETLATTNRVVLAGEVSGLSPLAADELEQTVRSTIREIGYRQKGFDWENVRIENYIHAQSDDIALGVDRDGAGDQGMMFGYATNECPFCDYMPAPLYFAHALLKKLSEKRKNGLAQGLEPDAKSQLTFRYENGEPVCVDTLIVSTQHHPDLSQEKIKEIIRQTAFEVLPAGFMCSDEHFYVNPTGRFVIGGPNGDTGLTGRKIVVDTYGGAAPHGGGAFSGKDPTKVDRSAAYMLRYLAKNIVAGGWADKCLLQVSYAIGMAHPLSFYVNTFGTGILPDSHLAEVLYKEVNLTPRGIRSHLNLNRPIYTPTAAYGHFGRKPLDNGSFSWEKLDFISELKKILPS